MPTIRLTVRIIVAIAAVIAAVVLVSSWLQSRAERARLASTIAAQQQLIAAAESRERDRDAALKSTLDEIATLKRTVRTPQQIVASLPDYLSLPQPIALVPAPTAQQGTAASRAPGQGSATPSDSGKGTALSSNSLGGVASSLKSEISNLKSPASERGSAAPCVPNSPAASSEISAAFKSAISDLISPRSESSGSPTERRAADSHDASEVSGSFKSEISNLKSPASSPSPNFAEAGPGQGTQLPARPQTLPDSPPVPTQSPSCPPGSAVIPAADLKPLYDYIQDCRVCQAQLSSARADLQDEKARSAALARERDAAVTAAKGGSFWRQLKRNAKWLAIGVAIGAAATPRHF